MLCTCDQLKLYILGIITSDVIHTAREVTRCREKMATEMCQIAFGGSVEAAVIVYEL